MAINTHACESVLEILRNIDAYLQVKDMEDTKTEQMTATVMSIGISCVFKLLQPYRKIT